MPRFPSLLLNLLLSLFAPSLACRPPEPVALTPIPPGVEYPWSANAPPRFAELRTMAGLELKRARLVALEATLAAVATRGLPSRSPDAPDLALLLPTPPATAAAGTGAEGAAQLPPDAAGATSPAGTVAPPGPPSANLNTASLNTVNLNTATLAELDALPRIGPALAQRIIAARPFDSVRDLRHVSGIGDATFEQLRPLVSVE